MANFKLREGMNIGAKVTLRGERMYEFWTVCSTWRFPRARFPRNQPELVRRPRQLQHGPQKEQLIFPEIDYDKIDKVRGMDICFVTTAGTDESA